MTSDPKCITLADDARAAGFSGFVTVGDVLDGGLPQDASLSECGVYLVCRPPGFKPRFIPPEEAAAAGNVDNPLSASDLRAKWVDRAEVLYIGQTTRPLQERLGELCKYAIGCAHNHYGGRILWQLRDSRQLLLCWKPTQKPGEFEGELIDGFKRELGKFPFANWRNYSATGRRRHT